MRLGAYAARVFLTQPTRRNAPERIQEQMDHTAFPLPPYRQFADECIPASLGTAMYPFIRTNVWDIVQAAIAFRSSAVGETGYERLVDIFNRSLDSVFVLARQRVSLVRVLSLGDVEKSLRAGPATAIISLSWPSGARIPHSVCVARYGDHFVLRDSAVDSLGMGNDGDAIASSLSELLNVVWPHHAEVGEAIVVRGL